MCERNKSASLTLSIIIFSLAPTLSTHNNKRFNLCARHKQQQQKQKQHSRSQVKPTWACLAAHTNLCCRFTSTFGSFSLCLSVCVWDRRDGRLIERAHALAHCCCSLNQQQQQSAHTTLCRRRSFGLRSVVIAATELCVCAAAADGKHRERMRLHSSEESTSGGRRVLNWKSCSSGRSCLRASERATSKRAQMSSA